MNKVSVLVEGYAKEHGDDGYQASSTVVLVESGKDKIICDPGINLKLLTNGLKKNNLSFEDINYVYLTHYHIDHGFYMSRFPRAKLLDFETVYFEGDKEEQHHNKIFGNGLKIVTTPGHSFEHSSLVVPSEKGNWVVAGDVFWWIDDEEQKTDRKSLIDKEDPIAEDMTKLKKSRKKLLEIGGVIIPGHGKMFEV